MVGKGYGFGEGDGLREEKWGWGGRWVWEGDRFGEADGFQEGNGFGEVDRFGAGDGFGRDGFGHREDPTGRVWWQSRWNDLIGNQIESLVGDGGCRGMSQVVERQNVRATWK